jgi:hypothetical protein
MSLAGHGRIDDLFGGDELGAAEPSTRERTARAVPAAFWLWLAITTVLTAVVELLFRLFLFVPPLLLLVAVCGGCAAIWLTLRAIAEPAVGRLGELMRARPPADRSAYRRADGMRDAIRRWTRRLEWGATGPQRYVNAVAPRLAELVDERLRQKYGLTMASDPAKARAALGEAAWAVLHPPPGTSPNQRQIAQTVDVLEKL